MASDSFTDAGWKRVGGSQGQARNGEVLLCKKDENYEN